ncbi:6-phosphogluconolactonase [Blastococcus sp. Marseille-P5729]|uniref:6-phosphogluconolactonase n=1 Tax=Blastococcus sp. Marseille-P5729 TaxID=2086582 RepID=UPI000D0E6E62|nr:6-phosphogluconolactonase [Blastococcus sp. Marseille-P5729]
MTVDLEVLPDAGSVARRAAMLFVETVRAAHADGRDAHVVVTGGGTGISVLAEIAQHADELDWARVHVWWGDERFVPHDSNDRNDVQADEALLAQVVIPTEQVHRVPASDGPYGDDPDAAAAAYAEELARHAPAGAPGPLFDVLMLGMGEEGHTASIFPHSPAAADARPVCAVRDCPKPPPTRVTMTWELLSHATEVWMMTTGAGKAAAVEAALSGADRMAVPAAGPQGRERTRWLLDQSAAGRLPS